MPERPSNGWRAAVAEQLAQVRAGTLPPEEAWDLELFPESLLDATDAALGRFEDDLAALDPYADDTVMAAVERVIRALNEVDADHGGAAYQADEREELCAYLDEALVAAGVDVAALAARQGVPRAGLTDRWRGW